MPLSRRDMMRAGAMVATGSAFSGLLGRIAEGEAAKPASDAEQWGIFEATFAGPSGGS